MKDAVRREEVLLYELNEDTACRWLQDVEQILMRRPNELIERTRTKSDYRSATL